MALQIIQFGQYNVAQCKTAYLKVLEKAYIFLIRFVRGNKENSNTILEYIEDFYNDLGRGVHAIELIMEIFVDNENLITFEMTGLVKRLANVIQDIDFDQTKKSTLISFMPRFMEYNGNHIKTIQNLILQEFTAAHRTDKLDYLYVGRNFENLPTHMQKMED